MGFHEDDRVRAKNLVANTAADLYSTYKTDNWSSSDIAALAEDELSRNPNNKVMYAILKMAIREATASQS